MGGTRGMSGMGRMGAMGVIKEAVGTDGFLVIMVKRQHPSGVARRWCHKPHWSRYYLGNHR